MAINKAAEAEQLNRFWPQYKRHALFIAIGGQLAGGLLITLLFIIFLPEAHAHLWIFAAGIGLLVIGTIIVTHAVLRPLDTLSSALVHISGEHSSQKPPNLNDKLFAKIRLRPLLQQIYALSSEKDDEPKANSTDGSAGFNLSTELNHTSSGIVLLNANQEVIYANKSAPVIIDSEGKTKLSVIVDSGQTIGDWLNKRSNHDIQAEKIWSRAANKLPGEEGRRLFDVFASYDKGSRAETILTFFDRTDEYQPEDDDLDFIAFAAHELRGPITVIRGYSETLNDELAGQLDDDQKELFQRLIVSANRLSGYINNILNASRYDRRHLRVHISEHHLTDIYQPIADDMEQRAIAQHRLLSVSLPEGLPTVAADLSSMGEVMGNLIDNAIKYSNEGGLIEVSADLSGDYVEVKVVDYGIGMPSNVVQNLFHKFYRSHRSRETVAGTGIGLYISKAITESNGGKMSVKSVDGEGSTFTFSLPTYASVQHKLTETGANNQQLIERSSSGWIKNHGSIRG